MVAPGRRRGDAPPDHYQVLGVAFTAPPEDIKAAFRARAREHHPDKNKEDGAAERFKELITAYEVLACPEKRQEYDLRRGCWGAGLVGLTPTTRGSRTAAAATAAPSGDGMFRAGAAADGRTFAQDCFEEMQQARAARLEKLQRNRDPKAYPHLNKPQRRADAEHKSVFSPGSAPSAKSMCRTASASAADTLRGVPPPEGRPADRDASAPAAPAPAPAATFTPSQTSFAGTGRDRGGAARVDAFLSRSGRSATGMPAPKGQRGSRPNSPTQQRPAADPREERKEVQKEVQPPPVRKASVRTRSGASSPQRAPVGKEEKPPSPQQPPVRTHTHPTRPAAAETKHPAAKPARPRDRFRKERTADTTALCNARVRSNTAVQPASKPTSRTRTSSIKKAEPEAARPPSPARGAPAARTRSGSCMDSRGAARPPSPSRRTSDARPMSPGQRGPSMSCQVPGRHRPPSPLRRPPPKAKETKEAAKTHAPPPPPQQQQGQDPAAPGTPKKDAASDPWAKWLAGQAGRSHIGGERRERGRDAGPREQFASPPPQGKPGRSASPSKASGKAERLANKARRTAAMRAARSISASPQRPEGAGTSQLRTKTFSFAAQGYLLSTMKTQKHRPTDTAWRSFSTLPLPPSYI